MHIDDYESNYVYGGQSQLILLLILLPKHELQAVVRQVSKWIFNAEQALLNIKL